MNQQRRKMLFQRSKFEKFVVLSSTNKQWFMIVFFGWSIPSISPHQNVRGERQMSMTSEENWNHLSQSTYQQDHSGSLSRNYWHVLSLILIWKNEMSSLFIRAALAEARQRIRSTRTTLIRKTDVLNSASLSLSSMIYQCLICSHPRFPLVRCHSDLHDVVWRVGKGLTIITSEIISEKSIGCLVHRPKKKHLLAQIFVSFYSSKTRLERERGESTSYRANLSLRQRSRCHTDIVSINRENDEQEQEREEQKEHPMMKTWYRSSKYCCLLLRLRFSGIHHLSDQPSQQQHTANTKIICCMEFSLINALPMWRWAYQKTERSSERGWEIEKGAARGDDTSVFKHVESEPSSLIGDDTSSRRLAKLWRRFSRTEKGNRRANVNVHTRLSIQNKAWRERRRQR